MQNIAITVRHSLSGELKGEFLKIIRLLKKQHKTVFVTPNAKRLLKNEPSNEDIAELSQENIQNIDLFIFFGGDGTLLKTLHNYAPDIFSIPIFGINAGNIGFFSSITPEEKHEAFTAIFSGKVSHDHRMIMKGVITDETGKEKETFYSLNEITIHHSGIARVRTIEAHVSDEFLTAYNADGLIISTPTGSTAYNVAAGGPIVAAQIDAFTITPLAPAGFSQRPIVLPAHKTLTFSPDAEMRISVDGQEYFPLQKEGDLIITKYRTPLTFLRLPQENYYKNLREKLGWGQ